MAAIVTLAGIIAKLTDNALKDAERRIAIATGIFEAIDKLAAAGVPNCEHSQWAHTYRVIDTDLSRLSKIHAVVGRLKVTGSLEPVSGKSRSLVWVTLGCEKVPNLHFRYQKKLPTGAKCKIKTVVHKERRVMCSV